MNIMIYTDGACTSRPRPLEGAWAACIIRGTKELLVAGYEYDTTNQRMELTAAINGLAKLEVPSRVTVYTDSRYVQKGITSWIKSWKRDGWKRLNSWTQGPEDIKNLDLWKQLDRLNTIHDVEWIWIPGHKGNRYNEHVDRVARDTLAKRSFQGA